MTGEMPQFKLDDIRGRCRNGRIYPNTALVRPSPARLAVVESCPDHGVHKVGNANKFAEFPKVFRLWN